VIQLWLLWWKCKNVPIIFACKPVKFILSFHSANVPQIFISLAYISTVSELLPSPITQQPLMGQDILFVKVSRSYSDTPHSVGLLWVSDQPCARNSTCLQQHSQETGNHYTSGIRTRNPSKRTAADPRLRPCNKWDRLGDLLQRKQLHSNEGWVSSKCGPLKRWGSDMLVNRWH